MWDELENYRPIIACSCVVPCSCGATASIRQYRDQDYVIRFLKGLNKKFTHSKSQIMMMNPLPDIDKAFSLVIQQERELKCSIVTTASNNPTGDEVTAFQIQTGSGNSASSNSSNKFGNNAYKGNLKVLVELKVTVLFLHTVEGQIIPLRFAFKSMDSLQDLRAKARFKALHRPMQPRILLKIIPVHISLPDGSQLTASISGSVELSPSLILHHVLYMPSFNVNLISIAKLVGSNNYHVHFNSSSCQILQNHSKEIIGIASLQRGLYVLDSSKHPLPVMLLLNLLVIFGI
ncbi:uncharacterized protein LOC131658603 [Vicia villosa]|uniref:uncharacterized protein LOC131658603 n=1 Tax=Vicia villosa TaxID=3911 RepID=UPI00273B2A5A|nr:uncharacterized protein LOC131658603 [Vicia villosa]